MKKSQLKQLIREVVEEVSKKKVPSKTYTFGELNQLIRHEGITVFVLNDYDKHWMEIEDFAIDKDDDGEDVYVARVEGGQHTLEYGSDFTKVSIIEEVRIR